MKRPLLPSLALAVIACGCGNNFAPYSHLAQLSVVAITAQPAEIAPGQTAALHAEVWAPGGAGVTYQWDYCVVPQSVAVDVEGWCAAPPDPALAALYVHPIGRDAEATVTMPPKVKPFALGLPDPTDGFYLPVRLIVSAGGHSVTSIFGLRDAIAPLPNHNPVVSGIDALPDAASGSEGGPLDDGAMVHPGQELTIRPRIAEGGAENYFIIDPSTIEAADAGASGCSNGCMDGSLCCPDGLPCMGNCVRPVMKTEVLRTSWFATVGVFSQEHTGQDRPDTLLTLPVDAAAGPLDLWAVVRDERGGTGYAHRTLQIQ